MTVADGTTAAAPTPDTAPAASLPSEAPVNVDDLDTAPVLDGQAPVEDDHEEVEWDDGKKYRVPKAVVPGLMKSADYTRKTMEVAQTRKELEAAQTATRQQAEAIREHFADVAKLQRMDDDIAQYQRVDWDTFERQNPAAAQVAWRKYELLKDARGKAFTALQQKVAQTEQTRTQQAQQETAKRLGQTAEWAAKNIPGWTPDLDTKITRFALEQTGMDADSLKAMMNPQVYQVFHLAYLGKLASSPKGNATPQPAPQPAPLQTVGARSQGAQRSLTDLAKAGDASSMAAYAARRKAEREAARR